jgi:hypothetical protein
LVELGDECLLEPVVPIELPRRRVEQAEADDHGSAVELGLCSLQEQSPHIAKPVVH